MSVRTMFFNLIIFLQLINFVYDKNISYRFLNDDFILVCEKTGKNKFFYKIGKGDLNKTTVFTAEAYLEESINSTGWNILEVRTYSEFDDETQAYFGGFIEGCVSTKWVYQHWYNTRHNYSAEIGQEKYNKIINFIHKNDEWIKNKILIKKWNNTYWWQVNLNYKQLQGIADGYDSCRDKSQESELTFMDFLLLNTDGDIEDLEEKFESINCSTSEFSYELIQPRKLIDEGRCSAIIKLLSNNEELLTSHVTWAKYKYLTRFLKRYIFSYHELPQSRKLVTGKEITFSSYPGVVSSIDDFYLISSNISVIETTIGNTNKDRLKYIMPGGTVLSFIRVMVANRLADSGRNWSKIFAKFNSGTYNNQWMIVDYNKFKPKETPKKGLLWVLEQVPGYIRAEDKTQVLKANTYWPSYNVPYYDDIFKMNGDADLVKLYGESFSYNGATRGKIMKRDHKKIKDVRSFMALMRSNNYKKDPLSKCNCTPPYSASNAISARHDLNPINGTYPFRSLGHRPGGAIDAKVVSASLIKNLQFIAVSGPTTGSGLPIFKWSTSDFGDKVSHLGQPNIWKFKPKVTNWKLIDVPIEC